MNQELRVALIQSSILWENPKENRRIFSEKIKSVQKNVDLILFPEMFTTGFTMTPQNISISEGNKTIEWMQNLAANTDAAIVGSLPYFENGMYTNRLLFVYPNGNIIHYDKRHTFTLAGEGKVYKAGNKKVVLTYKDFKICPMICYDLRFPVWSRNIENYDILLYVANWPKPRIAAWDTLLKARSIENMSYCIGVNRTGKDELGLEYSGHSGVYDCLGKQLSFSEKEEIIYTTLTKQHITDTREKLPFLEDRDVFTLEE